MNKVYEEIIQLAEGMEERMVTCRRDFHKYAESGWFEMRTSSLIARRLTELGYEVLVGEDVCKRDARMGVPSDEELKANYERAIAQGADPQDIRIAAQRISAKKFFNVFIINLLIFHLRYIISQISKCHNI